MTVMDQFEASMAAFYCWQQAAHIGDIQSMIAVGWVLRNRCDAESKGTLEVLEEAESMGPHATRALSYPTDTDARLRHFLYDFNSAWEGDGDDPTNGACYWYEMGRTPSDWMEQNVLGSPEEHPRVAQVGSVLFLR